MEILVLGGTGMLGHKLFQVINENFSGTFCTVKDNYDAIKRFELFPKDRVLTGVDALDFTSLERVLSQYRPRILINCIGLIKQRSQSLNTENNITLNALLPHKLARFCSEWGGRLIHFSTDCVFSGRRGQYLEEDPPDATELYGKTKSLGELTAFDNVLTLRTSFVGREIRNFYSLVEWFLQQRGRVVRGFERVIFSGVTTVWLAQTVVELIRKHPHLSGLYQLGGQPISKFDLLCLLRDMYGLDVEIIPDSSMLCDRTLRNEKFASTTGCKCPEWKTLIEQLVADRTPYDRWRVSNHDFFRE